MFRSSIALIRAFFPNEQTVSPPSEDKGNIEGNEHPPINLSNEDFNSEVEQRLKKVNIKTHYIKQIVDVHHTSPDVLLKKVELIELLIRDRGKFLSELNEDQYLELLGGFFSNEELYSMPQYGCYFGNDIQILAKRWKDDISKALAFKQRLDEGCSKPSQSW